METANDRIDLYTKLEKANRDVANCHISIFISQVNTWVQTNIGPKWSVTDHSDGMVRIGMEDGYNFGIYFYPHFGSDQPAFEVSITSTQAFDPTADGPRAGYYKGVAALLGSPNLKALKRICQDFYRARIDDIARLNRILKELNEMKAANNL